MYRQDEDYSEDDRVYRENDFRHVFRFHDFGGYKLYPNNTHHAIQVKCSHPHRVCEEDRPGKNSLSKCATC